MTELRKDRGITQGQLADATGIVRESISAYERGRYYPGSHAEEVFACFFNVTLDYFHGLTDEETPCDKTCYLVLPQHAYHLTGDWEWANDIVQKTFSVLLVKVNEVIVHKNPVGWLYRTLRNIYMQDLEKKTRLVEVPLNEEAILSSYFIQAQENNEALWDILNDHLSENEMQILQWRIIEQLSYYEIANLLGISEVACRQRVSRAIRHCREILSEKNNLYCHKVTLKSDI